MFGQNDSTKPVSRKKLLSCLCLLLMIILVIWRNKSNSIDDSVEVQKQIIVEGNVNCVKLSMLWSPFKRGLSEAKSYFSVAEVPVELYRKATNSFRNADLLIAKMLTDAKGAFRFNLTLEVDNNRRQNFIIAAGAAAVIDDCFLRSKCTAGIKHMYYVAIKHTCIFTNENSAHRLPLFIEEEYSLNDLCHFSEVRQLKFCNLGGQMLNATRTTFDLSQRAQQCAAQHAKAITGTNKTIAETFLKLRDFRKLISIN